ncbi:hypothetical protein ACVOMS_10425 [Bradyrhizobium guangxiense]
MSELGLLAESPGDDVALGIDDEAHPTCRSACALQDLADCIGDESYREHKLQLSLALDRSPNGYHTFAGDRTSWSDAADGRLPCPEDLFEIFAVGSGAHPISERPADVQHLISIGIDQLNRLPKESCFVDARGFPIERIEVRLVQRRGSCEGFGDLELETDLRSKPVCDVIKSLHGGSLRPSALLLGIQENDPSCKKRQRHRSSNEHEDQRAARRTPGARGRCFQAARLQMRRRNDHVSALPRCFRSSQVFPDSANGHPDSRGVAIRRMLQAIIVAV